MKIMSIRFKVMNKYSIPAIVIFIISFTFLHGQNTASPDNISPKDRINIPFLFMSSIRIFSQDFYKKDSMSYIDFCTDNNLIPFDNINFQSFYTFQILHKLFTSRSDSDCSKGQILDIPYFWHWIDPNPRFNIRFTSNGQLLKDTKPPAEFSSYRSFAEIDRTPFLFLSDLVSDSSKYYTINCDTFSTFGWCSEREMAFVALMSLLNFEGYVEYMGNHTCSVFLLPMKNISDSISYMRVTVDNTFDQLHFQPLNTNDLNEFKSELPYLKTTNWYNKMAHSKTELNQIKNFIVSEKAQQRINSKILKFVGH